MEGIPQLTIARVRFLRSFLEQGSAARNGEKDGQLEFCFHFSLLMLLVTVGMSLWIHARTHVITHLKGWDKLTSRHQRQLINSSST